ncbi:DMT family transporter [Sporosarcina sp. FSL K6-1522]|uniref:DMT family transporter n=1 Tax=Sporosarcina sp. FSL K6-1522 TaxID=2921554 RepID=UPI003159E4E6
MAFMLVIFSGLIHSLWNLFVKQSVSKITFLWSIHLVSFILLLPYFLLELPNLQLDGFGILLLMGSMTFQVFYVFTLITGYTIGELSLVYPVLRGSAALLVPITSILFFGDQLSILGWVGLLLILIGVFSMGNVNLQMGKKVKLSILIALAGGVSIAGYTLSDKVLLEYMSPIMIIQFQNFIYSIALLWGSFNSKQLKEEWTTNWKIILLGSLFVPGAYVLFLFALQLAQVSQLAPMREISIVFGTLLGLLFLKERQGIGKLVASCIIVIGIIVLGLFG